MWKLRLKEIKYVPKAAQLESILDPLTTLFTCNQRQVYQELICWDLGFKAPSLHRPPPRP